MKTVPAKVKARYTGSAWAARRWEAATETHRLNESHWLYATEAGINEDLQAKLDTLRARCTYERDENPIIDGMVFTHTVDIVGKDGPELQVLSDSERYNDWLEEHWRRWFRAPTPNSTVSGAALLRLWIQSLWRAGEFLAQKVTKDVDEPVQMRLRPVHPRRLKSPADMVGRDDVVMGIQFSLEGEPQRYFIEDERAFGTPALSVGYSPIPPDDIVHFFMLREEDQGRGVPWLATPLHPAAEIRDYDDHTMEAAKQGAATGVYWYADNPTAPFFLVNDSLSLERGQQSTGPPGWKPAMLTPQQPSTQYSDFRDARLMELGRPVAMPLMIIKLDAGRHNYSSARFDGKNYDRACEVIQHAISGTPKATGPLSELVDDVAREADLYERSRLRRPPKRPDKVTYEWTWPRPPQVDREKESDADRTDLEMGMAAPQDIAAARGTTLDALVAKRKRAHEKLTAGELPPIPLVLGRGSAFARRGDFEAAASDEPTPEPQPAAQSQEVGNAPANAK